MENLKMDMKSPEKANAEDNLARAREFAKKRITFDTQNLAEVSKELRDQFGVPFLDASRLAITINAEVREARAKELLATNDRAATIEKLKQELAGGKKLGRQKDQGYEKIATKIVERAINAEDKK